MRHAAAVLVVTFAAFALGPGCGDDGSTTTGTSSSSSGSASSSTGGPADCGLPPLSNATCEACLETHCCDQRKACSIEEHCDADQACLIGCDFDLTCVSANCPMLGQAVTPESLEVGRCAVNECSDVCPEYALTCDNVGFVGAPPGCDSCLQSNCCDPFLTAAADFDLQLCKIACADAACLANCDAMYPDEVAHASAAYGCVVDQCDATCSPPGGCGVLGAPGDCGTCMHDNCCAQFEACSKDAVCLDLLNCLGACSTPDCLDCIEAWPPDKVGLALAIFNCRGTACPVDCGGGQNCGLANSLLPHDCQTCITASCCAESSACGVDGDCAALEVCVELCAGDAACVTTCRDAHPNALASFDALAMCETANDCTACP